MRSRWVAVVGLALGAGAAASSACGSSYDAAPADDAGASADASTTQDAGGDADADAPCVALLPTLETSFDQGLVDLPFKQESDGGLVAVDGAELIVKVSGSDVQAEAYREATLTGAPLGRARLSFTVRDLAAPPSGAYAEFGCSLNFRSGPSSLLNVRLEQSANVVRLGVGATIAGSEVATGQDPTLGTLDGTPKTYPVAIDMVVDEPGSKVIATATAGAGAAPVVKEGPIGGRIVGVRLRCGVSWYTTPVGAMSTGWMVRIDDVRLELCAR